MVFVYSFVRFCSNSFLVSGWLLFWFVSFLFFHRVRLGSVVCRGARRGARFVSFCLCLCSLPFYFLSNCQLFVFRSWTVLASKLYEALPNQSGRKTGPGGLKTSKTRRSQRRTRLAHLRFSPPSLPFVRLHPSPPIFPLVYPFPLQCHPHHQKYSTVVVMEKTSSGSSSQLSRKRGREEEEEEESSTAVSGGSVSKAGGGGGNSSGGDGVASGSGGGGGSGSGELLYLHAAWRLKG